MTLEEVLQKYFNLSGPAFREDNGRFTDEGAKAYDKLLCLLYDISLLGVGIDYTKIERELDEIEYENY